MVSWKVAFEGKMKSARTHTLHQVTIHHLHLHFMYHDILCPVPCFQVRIDARYTATSPHFDFDSEMSAWTVARAMAREPWSREVSAAPSDDCIVCDLTCV